MQLVKIFFICFLSTFFVLGCAKKQSEIYNKPAIFWYKQIIKDIKDLDLEAADSHYTSMASEHVASPLLKEALLILAIAHMNEEEYILANFYLDEYIKRYGNEKNIEYARYLKIKANFNSFRYENRNQKLLLDTISNTQKYIFMYPNSEYLPLVETMLVKLRLAQYYLDEEIYKLYKRVGKAESAKIYKEKLEKSPLKDAKLIAPKSPWYRSMFE